MRVLSLCLSLSLSTTLTECSVQINVKHVHSTSFVTPAHNKFSLCSYRQTAPSGLGSQVQLNVEVLCQELTANIIKLEKVTHLFPVLRQEPECLWIAIEQGLHTQTLLGCKGAASVTKPSQGISWYM